MILIEIETTTNDKVTINPEQIVSIEKHRYSEKDTVQILMPGVRYYIPGTKEEFLKRLFECVARGL